MDGLVVAFRDWLWSRLNKNRRLLWGVGLSAGLGLLVLVAGGGWWLVSSYGTTPWKMAVDDFTEDQTEDQKVTAAQEVVLMWLARDYPTGWGMAQVVFGPSQSLPLWRFPENFSVEQIPTEVDDWEAMQAYLWQTQPQYVIIDSDTARHRQPALDKYFTYDPEGVHLNQLPAGWTLAYLYNSAGSPYTWSIFTPFRQPTRLMRANFGGQIELIGYDIVHNEQAQNLHVVLYWRAIGPIDSDYTAFLRLISPDGFVVATRERAPFDGQWPTSRWQTGDVLADRFELALNENIIPGDYLLLSGFHDTVSGQSVPLLESQASLASYAVFLDQVTLE